MRHRSLRLRSLLSRLRQSRLALLCGVLVFTVALTLQAPGVLAGSGILELRLPAAVTLGDPFAVQIQTPVDFAEAELSWCGRRFPLTFTRSGQGFGARLLLGTDVKKLAPGMKTLKVQVAKYGLTRSRQAKILVHKRKSPVQRLQLPENMVSLSPAVLNRHRREQQEVAEVLGRFSSRRLWFCPFQSPAPGDLSSSYGLRRILNGRPRSPHRGVDIRTGDRAPVKACNDGRVSLVAEHYFAGRCVYIDHGQGVVSMYFHLSKVEVRKGDPVQKGELIGRTGSSGRATGPHLHFGLSLQGFLVDPVPLFAPGCGLEF